MIRRFGLLASFAALVSLVAVPADAAWKLAKQSKTTTIAKSELQVRPEDDWNRNTYPPIAKSELWTIDGTSLNQLYFVTGLRQGETLFYDRNRNENPLPKMADGLLLAEIADFFESSVRISWETSLFEVTSMQPIEFAGNQGLRFTFDLGFQSSTVPRKGVVAATLVNGKLYMISFVAPNLHYYDDGLPKFEAVVRSAKFKTG